jgi:pilus assembly protein Flp/PilA
MKNLMMRLLREDEGQDLVEYVLLVSLIALAVALAFPPVAGAIRDVFQRVSTSLAAPPAGGGGGG